MMSAKGLMFLKIDSFLVKNIDAWSLRGSLRCLFSWSFRYIGSNRDPGQKQVKFSSITVKNYMKIKRFTNDIVLQVHIYTWGQGINSISYKFEKRHRKAWKKVEKFSLNARFLSKMRKIYSMVSRLQMEGAFSLNFFPRPSFPYLYWLRSICIQDHWKHFHSFAEYPQWQWDSAYWPIWRQHLCSSFWLSMDREWNLLPFLLRYFVVKIFGFALREEIEVHWKFSSPLLMDEVKYLHDEQPLYDLHTFHAIFCKSECLISFRNTWYLHHHRLNCCTMKVFVESWIWLEDLSPDISLSNQWNRSTGPSTFQLFSNLIELFWLFDRELEHMFQQEFSDQSKLAVLFGTSSTRNDSIGIGIDYQFSWPIEYNSLMVKSHIDRCVSQNQSLHYHTHHLNAFESQCNEAAQMSRKFSNFVVKDHQ